MGKTEDRNLHERCHLERNRGMDSSSMRSSSLGEPTAPKISWVTSNVCGAKLVVPIRCAVLLESDMVSRDHGSVGLVAAFFKESIMRDAMTGTKTVFTLWDSISILIANTDRK